MVEPSAATRRRHRAGLPRKRTVEPSAGTCPGHKLARKRMVETFAAARRRHRAVPLIALHASDESLDLQPPQRTERIAPVRRQPHFTPQTHRIGSGPEVFATVVEVADS